MATQKIKVMTVYGTRPEAIKVAPVVSALERSDFFESIPVVTGQHREMLAQVNTVFGIQPRYDLGVMAERQCLNGLLSRVIAGIDEVYDRFLPDAVLVQGDTSSAVGAAIAAFNRRIPVVHLEAGLRSGDVASPFPEEANRRLISQIAALHLAPTRRTQKNLLREGHTPDTIFVTGNTVVDALWEALEAGVSFTDQSLQKAVTSGRRIVLVTTHRRENLGKGIKHIGQAVAELAARYPQTYFVVPLHPNPAVQETIVPHLCLENILVTDPIAYGDFAKLMKHTYLVLTDSGGIQEEAPSLDIPVLVMRKNTERQEGLKAGTLKLTGTKKTRIVRKASALLDSPKKHSAMAQKKNPYGDGQAAQKSLEAIQTLFT